MFNKDFYPTPQEVAEKMLQDVDLYDKIVLEPSAGKGDLVRVIRNYGAKEIIFCEKNKQLSMLSASEADRFLKHDFLEVTSEEISHVDFIIMNPPFSNEEDHILHAWEIAPGGCTIISLCNHQMLSNSYSKQRGEIKKILGNNGRCENFGDCFSASERRTGVEVDCIWLFKPKTGDEEWDEYFDLSPEYENFESGLVGYNQIQDLVSRYVGAVKLFDKIIPLAEEANNLTRIFTSYGVSFGAYSIGNQFHSANEKAISRDEYKKTLQKQAWNHIFSLMNMGKYLTQGVRDRINTFVEKQTHVPFTKNNIFRMLDVIVGTHESRVNMVFEDAFNMICSFSWKDNCTGGEGWKTNSDYMVNKKFIIPGVGECYSRYGNYSKVNLCSGSKKPEKIQDIVRALCQLTAKNYDKYFTFHEFAHGYNHGYVENGEQKRLEGFKKDWGQWYEWEPFFRVKFFKVGTVHIEFLDDSVWSMFNLKVAEIRNWPKVLGQMRKKTKKTKIKCE